jgi:hypothetical protein
MGWLIANSFAFCRFGLTIADASAQRACHSERSEESKTLKNKFKVFLLTCR